MELNFKSNETVFAKTVYDGSFIHEETLDMIVPDALPDIDKMISAGGVVLLRGKNTENGRAIISGQAELNILYLPEGSNNIAHTEAIVPFSVPIEAAEITSDSRITTELSLYKASAKVINPRKLLIKAEIRIEAVCYTFSTSSVVSDMAEPDENIELLKKKIASKSVKDVSEKTFVITDEMSLPASKPAAEELLGYTLTLETGESKCVGNKLIFKGTAYLKMLYRSRPDGTVVSAEMSTVFSQIIETDGINDDMEFSIGLAANGVYISLNTDEVSPDGRFETEIHIVAQCVSVSETEIEYISDMYSPSFELEAEYEDISIDNINAPDVVTEDVREPLRTAYPVKSIVRVEAGSGTVIVKSSGSNTVLETSSDVTLIYYDENNILRADSKRIEVSASLEDSEHKITSAKSGIAGEAYAALADGGAEVRFQMQFTARHQQKLTVGTVKKASYNEENRRDMTKVPSVMLYRAANTDTLWEIARRFSSTRELIAAANAVETDAELIAGTLLIIPKKR